MYFIQLLMKFLYFELLCMSFMQDHIQGCHIWVAITPDLSNEWSSTSLVSSTLHQVNTGSLPLLKFYVVQNRHLYDFRSYIVSNCTVLIQTICTTNICILLWPLGREPLNLSNCHQTLLVGYEMTPTNFKVKGGAFACMQGLLSNW